MLVIHVSQIVFISMPSQLFFLLFGLWISGHELTSCLCCRACCCIRRGEASQLCPGLALRERDLEVFRSLSSIGKRKQGAEAKSIAQTQQKDSKRNEQIANDQQMTKMLEKNKQQRAHGSLQRMTKGMWRKKAAGKATYPHIRQQSGATHGRH